MKRAFSVLAGLAIVACVCAPVAGSAQPRSVVSGPDLLRIRYAVSLIGLPLGTASVTGVVGPSAYRLEANGKLTGLAGVIVNSRGAATATGSVAGGRINPATFAATAATSSDTLTIRIAMSKGNATGVEIVPAYEQRPDRIPLTEADRRSIIDPLSSFVMAVPGSGDPVGPGACDRTLPIFDGGVRFDIALSFKGTREVKAAGYSGPVAVCSARYKPIAGYRPNRPATKFMIANKDMEVWLAPVGRTRYVVPYRISVLTMVGTTVIEATEFAVGPVSKAANAVP